MIHLLFTSLIILSAFLGSDCREEPVQPANRIVDTTSHAFSVVRVDTLGTLFSFANGVDIVNENNIWVAGIFTERDTNGEIVYNKNLAHWNGTVWRFLSVPMMGYNNTGPSPEELKAVKVFNDSNIFVISKYNSHARWDGKTWTSYFIDPQIGYLERMWARSPDDIYFVGGSGRATHWNGQTFTKITTGLTNPPLTGVWGDDNSVYAVGYGSGGTEGRESVFLFGSSTQLNISNRYDLSSSNENNPNFLGGMNSIFRASKNSSLWILSGWGRWKVYKIESISPFTAVKNQEFPFGYPAILISGTADNDIYVLSSLYSEFFHYNGNTWLKYNAQVSSLLTFDFTVKHATWAMVGSLRNGVGTAMIIVGKHN